VLGIVILLIAACFEVPKKLRQLDIIARDLVWIFGLKCSNRQELDLLGIYSELKFISVH